MFLVFLSEYIFIYLKVEFVSLIVDIFLVVIEIDGWICCVIGERNCVKWCFRFLRWKSC